MANNDNAQSIRMIEGLKQYVGCDKEMCHRGELVR